MELAHDVDSEKTQQFVMSFSMACLNQVQRVERLGLIEEYQQSLNQMCFDVLDILSRLIEWEDRDMGNLDTHIRTPHYPSLHLFMAVLKYTIKREKTNERVSLHIQQLSKRIENS